MIRKKTEKILENIFYKLAVGLDRLQAENPKAEQGKRQQAAEIVLLYDIAKYSAKKIRRLKNESNNGSKKNRKNK